jgi:mannitol/fructose-specific phosphotransferase system IIA component (Ntr-type)
VIFSGARMKISELVCFDAVIPELKSSDRDGAIGELVDALGKAKRLGGASAGEIKKALIKRENEASTGLGRGVAVPHVKHTKIRDAVVAIGRSGSGIDFVSLDKQPVYSVLLLLSPADDADKHLQAMESIFKHLQRDNFRKFLRQSQTTDQIKDLIKEADENPSL